MCFWKENDAIMNIMKTLDIVYYLCGALKFFLPWES